MMPGPCIRVYSPIPVLFRMYKDEKERKDKRGGNLGRHSAHVFGISGIIARFIVHKRIHT